MRDGDDGRDRVEREHHVGHFHHKQTQEQRRGLPDQLAGSIGGLHEEIVAAELVVHGDEALGVPDGPVLGVVDDFFLLTAVHGLPHLPRRPEHEDAETRQRVGAEHRHQGTARRHENQAQDQRAEDAVVQNPVLERVLHRERTENGHDDEQVVH